MRYERGNSFYYSKSEFINYQKMGHGKLNIVFLHGFGASLRVWTDILKFFPEDNFTVYLLDLKGAGYSSKPANSDYSIPANAEIVVNFIIEKNIGDYILVGHSLGGGVALLTAISFLDYPHYMPKGMILLDTAAYKTELPFFVQRLNIPILSTLILKFTSPDFQARYTLSKIYYDPSKITQEKVERYSYFFSLDGHDDALLQTAHQIIPKDFNQYTNQYKNLNVPTLVIWGKQDPALPLATGTRLALELPSATLKVIDKCGHNPQEEWPEETAKYILDFIFRLGI